MFSRNVPYGPILALGALVLVPQLSAGQPSTPEIVEATVLYGDERLFEGDLYLDDDALAALWDSLCALPETPAERLRDLELFLRIRSMDEEDLVRSIDSLFALEEVPYALINEVAHRTAAMPTELEIDRSAHVGWSANGAIPCHDIYGEWHVHAPNAYGPELSTSDSIVLLELTREHEGCGMCVPVPGVLTSRFGWRQGRAHNGIDLDLRTGEPVRAMFPGVVRFANVYGSYGKLVVIRHYNGLETYYAHLSRIHVGIGTEVEAGTVIGAGGNTGRSTGSHLHFEVRYKGLPIDPLRLFDPGAGSLVCNELVLKRTRWSFTAFPRGTTTHIVTQGEQLHSIAMRYGTSVDKLCTLNGLSRTSRLAIGQELVVHADPHP